MSCRTCSYSEQKLISHGNGMWEEKYICMGQKETPEVNPDDICEFYKDKFKDKKRYSKLCGDCQYFKAEELYGIDGRVYDGICENLKMNSDPTRPMTVYKTNSCDIGEEKMSCKTCIYCVTETHEMEHGPDQEFYKCTFYEGAPYVRADDICGNYSNGEPEIADISDCVDRAKELYGIKNPPVNDLVSHPSHYTEGRKYEPKDVIRDWGLNFNLGSAVKYISRAGRKDDIIQDLKKAKQFLDFEIDYLEENK